MWHASVSPLLSIPTPANTPNLFRVAEDALRGVGDAGLGEWREVGDKAVHLRRRLAVEEAVTVGPVVDVRGTREAQRRLWRASQWLPPSLMEMAREELA